MTNCNNIIINANKVAILEAVKERFRVEMLMRKGKRTPYIYGDEKEIIAFLHYRYEIAALDCNFEVDENMLDDEGEFGFITIPFFNSKTGTLRVV
jgi:hypothetical protein